MRITYRNQHVDDYWIKRWDDIPVDNPMVNCDAYPLKYSNKAIKSKNCKILEAGCGAGRILRHYSDLGYDIIGIDYVENVIKKIKNVDVNLKVEVGDIKNLNFKEKTSDSRKILQIVHSSKSDRDFL